MTVYERYQKLNLDTGRIGLAETFGLTPMENAFAEVKRVQAYYDCKKLEPPHSFAAAVIPAASRKSSPLEGVRWVFFDIGSTLVDESRAYDRRIRETVAGSGVSYEQFYEEMLDFYRQNKKGDLEAAKKFGLTLPPWYSGEERLYPDAVPCLQALQGRFYLGVIANQPPGTAARLEKMGLAPYFDRVISSAEEGVAKPDPAIFQIALERAGCCPEEAVMTGDRLDNDIAPAKRLGMKTIWIKRGFGGLSSIRTPGEKPDFIVKDLSELQRLILSR